ncbi:MAG: hypothetical protein ABF505_12635 [Schleiferilactobacillus harbinensis]|uniref:RNA polymerase factor sigma-54 n=1 Tax=Schleiferilactobacillus harbinensis TaxID=304207 RepID=UPI0039ED7A55
MSHYARDDQDFQRYLRTQERAYHSLQSAYAERQNTLLHVVQLIVVRQHAFFTDPSQTLQPLLVKDIAEELKLSPSTISRTINGKYLEFSQHVYELRHFFTYRSTVGYSQDAVLTAIQTLIGREDRHRPLTDGAVVTLLAKQGIKISRRTVVKYRDKLNIKAAHRRRQF